MDLARVVRAAPEVTELRARFFRALGDPKRLKILELLLEGEKTVGELVQALQAPQGRVSNHLACLRWCGFVETRRAGRFVFYRLADPRVRELIRLADGMITDNATAIATCTRIEPAGEGEPPSRSIEIGITEEDR